MGTIIARRKGVFWSLHSLSRTGRVAGSKESDTERELSQEKAKLLKILDDTRRIMTQLGETQHALKLAEDYESIERETRKKLPKAVNRALDEDCFWELIETAKRHAQSCSEQMDLVETALEAFKAAEIKKFQQILDAQLDALLHWDVWALGYVAMDGCSDDAFEYFRCWLILQGRHVVATALEDVEKLKRLPPGILEAEELLSIPGTAYESRSGKAMRLGKRKPAPIKGNEWEESDLPTRYPKLCKRYA